MINLSEPFGTPIQAEGPMQQSIEIMKSQILDIIADNDPSIYLFGSVVLDDFKLGWSDIDILCLVKTLLSDSQADRLLNLRQELLRVYPENLYFRSFEGGFLTREDFLKRSSGRAVYWGTSGQRITDSYSFDVFSTMELLDSGKLLYGADIRSRIPYPTLEEQQTAVLQHYQIIRKYALNTNKSLYSAGWLLDIARCIYTLRTGKIIAKTAAGEWALAHNIAPDNEVLKRVLEIRRNPIQYKGEPRTLAWLESLGPQIQSFANQLEDELIQIGVVKS